MYIEIIIQEGNDLLIVAKTFHLVFHRIHPQGCKLWQGHNKELAIVCKKSFILVLLYWA